MTQSSKNPSTGKMIERSANWLIFRSFREKEIAACLLIDQGMNGLMGQILDGGTILKFDCTTTARDAEKILRHQDLEDLAARKSR